MIPVGIIGSARVPAALSGILNHVVISAPRNGTTSHTANPSSGTVVSGTAFNPASGRLLICIGYGAVTFTTSSGWSLASGGSAVNFGGLYLWYRTAAGGDSFTTTHNGSNYPAVFEFFEYSSSASFISCASSVNVSNGGAGPTLSSLTGTYDAFAAAGFCIGDVASTSGSCSWNVGTEQSDTFTPNSGTDGYLFSTTLVIDRTGATWSAAATVTGNGNIPNQERLCFAIRK